MTGASKTPTPGKDTLRDFTTTPRILLLSLMAVVTGGFGTAAAWVLLKLIAVVTNFAYFQTFDTHLPSFSDVSLPAWTIAIPVVGGLIVGLMARFGSDKIRGHGIPEAIEAILIGRSRIEPKVAILKPLSSAIAIGSGGPFGAEGPIIMTGGALGSLFAQMFQLSSPERKTLLVAGAAAGMTAVFNTPIAAILLAVELLLFEWKPRSFVPVAVASLVASLLRPLVLGGGAIFPYDGLAIMPWWGLALCAVAGVVAGLQSALMTICLYGVEDGFRKLPVHWMWWPAIGGIVVGIGGWIDPSILGVGYDSIRELLHSSVGLHAATSLLIGKMVIWIVALSSGTSGGVLAPLLIMGGALGAIAAHILPFGDPGFWALIGMTAILGGTMRAPLTATMFAVELTGNMHIMPAVMTASVAAFVVTVLLMRRSILTERIARRGLHLTREYTVDPFDVMRVADIMAKPADSLSSSITIREAINFFEHAEEKKRHKSYPVVDDAQRVTGMISRADVLRWTREGFDENEKIAGHQHPDTTLIGYSDELVGVLADRMAVANVGRVPVIDRTTKALVGLVARRDLLRVRAHTFQDERERASSFHFFG